MEHNPVIRPDPAASPMDVRPSDARRSFMARLARYGTLAAAGYGAASTVHAQAPAAPAAPALPPEPAGSIPSATVLATKDLTALRTHSERPLILSLSAVPECADGGRRGSGIEGKPRLHLYHWLERARTRRPAKGDLTSMKLFRRPILGLSALAATLTLTLGAAPAVAQTQVTIQSPIGINSHYGAGTTAFKETFERMTNNRFRVVFQRNDNEREMIEAVQIGTIECTITSTGPVGNFVPEIRNLDVPFLFRDTAHARGVLDSAIGQEMLALFPARGIVAVAWLENGFRHMTNSRREINTPADVRGLKMRTMENPVHMRAFQTLGALPTPMAFSELVPALQQGTVDGQENPISVILNNNLNQVQRFLTLTGHVYSPALLLCNPAFVGRLNAADRAALVQAGRDAAVANRARATSDEQTGVDELRRRGMTVVTQVDSAAFQAVLATGAAQIEAGLDDDLLRRIREWRPGS